MALTYKDLQDEVKRRATRDQGGSVFDTAIKNTINMSLFRISREAPWRSMRRKDTFDTIATYTTGSGGGTFTNDSKSVTITSATLLTDNIRVGRRIKLQGSSKVYTIKTITGETTLTIDIKYDGTTISGTGTYSILGQEEYNLPVQAGHRTFLWHEDFGTPFKLEYIPDQSFFGAGIDNTIEDTPEAYRMWGEDWIDRQVLEPSVMTISSSDSGDTNKDITFFGTVSNLPDSETVTTNSSNGTTTASGSKLFSHVERAVKDSDTTGRITCTSNSANNTVVILPTGDTTAGILYKKVQLHPLPNSIIPINVQYYKDPYRLVNDDDVHALGSEFDEAIILLSTSKVKFESNQSEGEQFFVLYQDEVNTLKRTNMDKIDWIPKLRRYNSGRQQGYVHSQLRYSQAGSQYGRSSRR